MKVPDGDPAICATTQSDVSQFKALVKGRIRGADYFSDANGNTVFRVPADKLEDMKGPDLKGYVNILRGEAFEVAVLPVPPGCSGPEPGGGRAAELRASSDQESICIVEVRGEHFPYTIVAKE